MDIGQFVFPFMMAVITNIIMIVAIWFLRKIPYFANLFSVWFMVVLYLVGVVRVFLPLEFPDVQIILRDTKFYSFLVDSMAQRTDDALISPNIAFYVLLAVWLIGMIVFAVVSVYIHRERSIYYFANYDFTTDEEKEIFDRISTEILGEKKNVVLKKTDGVKYIMVIGYFKKYVFLPEKDYTADELEMIFRHECTHLKNKDLWLKLLVHIYCCIFWWNPFSYLLKNDLDFTLEMRCDLSATKNFTDEQKRVYFETLTNNCHQRTKDNKHDKNYFFLCSELSDRRKNNEFVRRTAAITKDPPNRVGQIIVNTLVSLILVAVFVFSYVFIWQPDFGIDVAEDDYGLAEDEFIVDGSDGFLVEQEDGSYLFYFANFPPEYISKEEVEEGMYLGYPILEN